jgi:hypothetical protein
MKRFPAPVVCPCLHRHRCHRQFPATPAAGNQNNAIPAGVDLADFRSVSIWCDRFNVSFGTAPLSKA